jgi:hypothetical protein
MEVNIENVDFDPDFGVLTTRACVSLRQDLSSASKGFTKEL